MLAELHNKGGSFCEPARQGQLRCPLLIRSTSEDVITGELVHVLRAINPRWWLAAWLNAALGTDRFRPQVYKQLRIEPWVNQPPYPRELLPWTEGSTQVDIEISWENPPTTVFIEAKYQSDLAKSTSNSGDQTDYPTDQLLRNIRVGLYRCGYFDRNVLFEMKPRDFMVILLCPCPDSSLVKKYRERSELLRSIPYSDQLIGLPGFPFVGELGYTQINQILAKQCRFLTRAERTMVQHLKAYLDFKKGTMRQKGPNVQNLDSLPAKDEMSGAGTQSGFFSQEPENGDQV